MKAISRTEERDVAVKMLAWLWDSFQAGGVVGFTFTAHTKAGGRIRFATPPQRRQKGPLQGKEP